MTPRLLPALALALFFALAGSAAAATEADPSEFFRRLESIGLKTEYLRDLCGKIELFYRKPSATAEAEWGYILENVYVPFEFKEESSNRIKFDLESHHINTFIHELTHAAYSMGASESAPAGSVNRHHWEAVNSIWADLYLDERNNSFGMPRYPRMKANEVSAYFMGAAIMSLFWTVGDLITFNTVMTSEYMKSPEDAERLGDKLILPGPETDKGFGANLRKARFGTTSASDIAYFENKPVHWEQRDHVKSRMWNNILGLQPPSTVDELLERLNSLDNEWIKGIRRKLVEARKKRAEALAKVPTATGEQDPLDAAADVRRR